MVRRTTWILLLVFVLLVGFAWFFPRYLANKAKNEPTATPVASAASLYNLAIADVNAISISASTGEKVDLYKDPGSSNWAIAEIPVDQANSSQIESTIKQLLSLQVKDTLGVLPPLDTIGLSAPAYTLTMTTTDGTKIVTSIGAPNAIGDGYYVQVGSDPVVIIDNVVMDDVINMIKQPPLKPTATPEVTATETAVPTENGSQVTPTP